jgi:hypothetical protein
MAAILLDDEEPECPLCAEPLDATDLQARLCSCSFQPCLFCWQRLLDEAAASNELAKCPNCRTLYDEERIEAQRLDPQLCVVDVFELLGGGWSRRCAGRAFFFLSRAVCADGGVRGERVTTQAAPPVAVHAHAMLCMARACPHPAAWVCAKRGCRACADRPQSLCPSTPSPPHPPPASRAPRTCRDPAVRTGGPAPVRPCWCRSRHVASGAGLGPALATVFLSAARSFLRAPRQFPPPAAPLF